MGAQASTESGDDDFVDVLQEFTDFRYVGDDPEARVNMIKRVMHQMRAKCGTMNVGCQRTILNHIGYPRGYPPTFGGFHLLPANYRDVRGRTLGTRLIMGRVTEMVAIAIRAHDTMIRARPVPSKRSDPGITDDVCGVCLDSINNLLGRLLQGGGDRLGRNNYIAATLDYERQFTAAELTEL